MDESYYVCIDGMREFGRILSLIYAQDIFEYCRWFDMRYVFSVRVTI